MADQDRLAETLEPFPAPGGAEQSRMDPATPSLGKGGSQALPQQPRTDMTNLEPPVTVSTITTVHDSVVLVNDRGNRYITPFELCRSRETLKPLLKEIYSGLDEPERVRDVEEGKFEIQTENGGIILPSVWRSFVTPGSTIRVAFYSVHNGVQEERKAFIYEQPEQSVASGDDRQGSSQASSSPSAEGSNEGSEAEEDLSDEDLDSESGSESESETAETVKPAEPVRDIVLPVDAEGNRISFRINTLHPPKNAQPANGATTNGDTSRTGGKPDTTGTQAEILRITKAAETEEESKSVIQLHTLPGPENIQLRKSVNIAWHHIPAHRLDFNRFKNVCLTLPGLSERMRMLVQAMIKRIEEHKIKAFLGGLFIEPGTVLRVDERDQPEPQSVIFSCVPYFELYPLPPKTSTNRDNTLFPVRTLMQSYYPYEPTRDRDQEQAYTIFNNDHAGDVISVPNLWIMNIGTDFVVTCGHKPLAQNLMKSIEIVPEDLEQLTKKTITTDSITNIRLKDWDDRVLFFNLHDCRTFFQLEQKIREIRWMSSRNFRSRTLKVVQRTPNGVKKVEPGDWRNIVQRTDLLFIDLALDDKTEEELKEEQDKEQKRESTRKFSSKTTISSTPSLVPPFFSWPSRPDMKYPISEKGKVDGLPFADRSGSTYCLDNAEKGMLSQTLDKYQTVNEVDGAFTSTEYYQNLPEDTYEHVVAQFPALRYESRLKPGTHLGCTHHEYVLDTQRSSICDQTVTFFETVHATLKLFLNDIDRGTMLRKVWGAMFCVYKMIIIIKARGTDQNTLQPPPAANHRWYIRSDTKNPYIPAPETNERLKHYIKRCRRCQSFEPFDNEDAALAHLQKHMDLINQRDQKDAAASSSAVPPNPPMIKPTAEPNLKAWVMDDQQVKTEQTNAGALAIIAQACKTAEELYFQAKDLANGVEDEEGRKSDLYYLPRQITDAFREIIVFYLAIERALHVTEQQFQKDKVLEVLQSDPYSNPFSDVGLDILKRFGEGAKRSLFMSRAELCRMVASPDHFDIFHHLCLGPEYVCAWLMRRLLVKPLQDRLTAGDMYRAYLSTMQFQVNHRPSKRLLRSISLLQEELHVLNAVNKWQNNLIQNFSQVLDDATYAKDTPFRRAMFPYERMLLRTCLDNLNSEREEFNEMIRRCNPLSDSTKQALEITEEDHGKSIMVFTVVTVIFLPLSFVTSYLGMNTNDVRNMNNNQSLFWEIALPLTFVVMALCVFISYKGSSIQDQLSSIYRSASGKDDQGISARDISIAQRRRAGIIDTTLADEDEYANPQEDPGLEDFKRRATMGTTYTSAAAAATGGADMPTTRTGAVAEYTSAQPATTTTTTATAFRRRLPQSRLMQTTTKYTETINLPPPPPTMQENLQSSQQQERERPTYTRIEKRFLEEESLRAYSFPFESDPSNPAYWLIRQTLSDREQRVLFEHTAQLRSQRRTRKRYGYEPPPVPPLPGSVQQQGVRYDAIPERRKVVLPPPVQRMSLANETFGVDDGGGEGDGGLVGYTWIKKRRGHGRGGGRYGPGPGPRYQRGRMF